MRLDQQSRIESSLSYPLRSKKQAVRVLQLIRKIIHQQTSLGKVSSEKDSTPFKVLISAMLSARTRDPVTEAASARLFKKYPDARSLSHARRSVVSKLIRPVSFYSVKAGRVIQVAKALDGYPKGQTPKTMDELLKLPGVGRKTANCVLVYAYNTPAIPVDVHVHRISNRIGLVRTNSPEQTEIALSKLYEKSHWLEVNELFVSFGQTICKPVVPRCGICNVQSLCNYYKDLVEEGKRPASG